MNLFTLGYEGLSLAEFLDVLSEYRVKMLVDVRKVPLSRKPGFSKATLRSAVEQRGISYVHVEALGAPKEIRDAYKLDENWSNYTVKYLSYLDRHGAEIDNLTKLVALNVSCLLCFEADASRCHRSYVAEAVSKLSKGWIKVIHLKAPSRVVVGKQVPHLALVDR